MESQAAARKNRGRMAEVAHEHDPRKYKELVEAQLRRDRGDEAPGVYQPAEGTWRDFLHYKGWSPSDLGDLPEDWLLGEWGRYFLRAKFRMLP